MTPDDPKRGRTPGGSSEGVPIPERIRRRREERGVQAYALAERLGISPSYISLIESGKKVPSEDIARRIAEALDDDPEIYVVWVHSAGIDDLEGYATRLMKYRHYSSDPKFRQLLESGEDIDETLDASEPREQFSRATPPATSPQPEARGLSRGIVPLLFGKRRAPARDLTQVDLLEDGVDPQAKGRDRRTAGAPLQLDARLFDPDDLDHLFAYRVKPAMVGRVGDGIRPGDWVILSSRVDPKSLHGVFAVRIRGTIVLGRVILKGTELLLLPPPGSSELESVELRSVEDARRALAGRVVRTVRASEG